MSVPLIGSKSSVDVIHSVGKGAKVGSTRRHSNYWSRRGFSVVTWLRHQRFHREPVRNYLALPTLNVLWDGGLFITALTQAATKNKATIFSLIFIKRFLIIFLNAHNNLSKRFETVSHTYIILTTSYLDILL